MCTAAATTESNGDGGRTRSMLRGRQLQRRMQTGTEGDGSCDIDLNTAQYNYDGGDCCEETCQNPDGSACDYLEWIVELCIDPSVVNYLSSAPGNGRCEEGLNNDEGDNNYDGGDCCWQTCIPRPGVEGDCIGIDNAVGI